MLQENHLTVRRTARYYTIGNLTDQTKSIWFCLHGFGQLAQFFSRKFTGLDDGQTFIVVPEGLSRSYLTTDYQRVGASWMTKEDKDCEINDFLFYLNSLYDLISAHPNARQIHTTVLGFSQGAATACRWLNSRIDQPASTDLAASLRVDRLILWAGFFPDGFHQLIDPAKLATVETHYVYGLQDEYMVQMDNIDGYLHRLQTEMPGLKLTAFEGSHRVEPEVLASLIH